MGPLKFVMVHTISQGHWLFGRTFREALDIEPIQGEGVEGKCRKAKDYDLRYMPRPPVEHR